MLQHTLGIVFRSVKYGETSLISKVYTEQFGIQSYIIKGARSSKSKTKAGLLQPLSLLDMQVYHRENKNINHLKEINPAVIFTSIPFDVLKSSVGIFMIEILLQTIREEEKNPTLFRFLFDTIKELDERKDSVKDFHLLFLVRLSKLLGFFPSGNFSGRNNYFDLQEGIFTSSPPSHPLFLSGDSALAFSALIQSAENGKTIPDFSSGKRKELLNNLLTYYGLHISNFKNIRTVKILEEVLRG